MSASVPALDIHGVSKRYGETRALIGLDMTCQPGTVHTLFGENGSGKSTFVKTLSGIVAPDEGTIRVFGQPVSRYEPAAMRALGIAPVMQEVLVAPNRSVVENIFMGYDGLLRRRISRAGREARARAVLAELTATPIDLFAPVEALPLPQQQIVVIARALVRDPRILILDEATSALDLGDRERLFAVMRAFVAGGRVAIFISHRIDEVLALSDFVTVLRSGRKVTTAPRAELSPETLLGLLTAEEAEMGHG